MKHLLIGNALAIGLTGCGAAADATPKEAPPTEKTGMPFDIGEVVSPSLPQTTPCLMVVPDHWLCPEGVSAPEVMP